MRKQKLKCQVCFFPRSSDTQISELISCKGCKRSAHRYCYWPQLIQKTFLCDVCNHKNKNQVCAICGNDGLLKRTEDGIYGHPICFMLCKSALVKSYQNLSFDFFRNKKRSKMGVCKLCLKNSNTIDLFSCFEKNCNEKAHFYCILKDQWKNNQQSNKWVQDLKIFDSSNFNFLDYYTDRVKRYIRSASILAYKSIFGDKKIRQQDPIWIVYCQDHCENLTNCFCIQLQQKITKTDWVYCDSCGKWYHFDCEQIMENNLASDQYSCKCCENWHKKINSKQTEPIVQNYPKLQFYDFVYIQHFADNKGYRLSASMNQLIRKVPFICSIKYFNEILKDKQLISRILKNINFLAIKKQIIDKNHKRKQSTKNVVKPNKTICQIIWKLDFLVSTSPIQCINKMKKGQYKYQQLLNIFIKYNKKYVEGSNVIKPAIKQLTKIKNNQSDEDQQQNNNQSLKEASDILKKQIRNIRQMQTQNKYQNQNILSTFFTQIIYHQLLKQVAKDYLDQKLNNCEILQPIFLYDTQFDMFTHIKLKFLFKQHKMRMKNKKNQNKIRISSQMWTKLYYNSNKKVQIQNINLFRQIDSYGNINQQQNNRFNNKLIIPFNKKSIKFVENDISFKQTTENKQKYFKSNQQLAQFLQSQLKNKWINIFLKRLSLKSNSLNKLYSQYCKIDTLISNKESSQTYKNYIKFYKSAHTLFASLSQGTVQEDQNQKYNGDMLQFISASTIDRLNIYKFCLFFISSCQLNLQNLNQMFSKFLSQKGLQFLNFISSRAVIFQCQAEYRAASHLMQKFSYDHPKIKDLILKNLQLLELLSIVTFQSLENVIFFQRDVKTLHEARDFCLQNNLQFRIGKIQYMLKFYQCKQEAFKYFQPKYIVKDIYKLPSKFSKITAKKSVDYYILKKFMYKMKLLKFPLNDHMFVSLNDLCVAKTDYCQLLSSVISTYNALIKGQVNLDVPRYNKNYILYIIHENKKQYVTFGPQQDEIQILCEIYDKALQKLNRAISSKTVDKNFVLKAYKQLMMCPFQIENKQRYDSLFEDRTVSQQQIIGQLIEDHNILKNQLDETSAKGQGSNKSAKALGPLISQIKSKPKAISLEQVEKKLQRVNQFNDSRLYGQQLAKIASKCKKICEDNCNLIEKFQKKQTFQEFEIDSTRRIINAYDKQNIRVQVLQNMSKQLKIYDQLSNSDLNQENPLFKVLHQSFVSAYYNKSVSSSQFSQRNQQTQVRPWDKQKKTRVLFRK